MKLIKLEAQFKARSPTMYTGTRQIRVKMYVKH